MTAQRLGEERLEAKPEPRSVADLGTRLPGCRGVNLPSPSSKCTRGSARWQSSWDQDTADLAVFDLVETTADHIRNTDRFSACWRHPGRRGRKNPEPAHRRPPPSSPV